MKGWVARGSKEERTVLDMAVVNTRRVEGGCRGERWWLWMRRDEEGEYGWNRKRKGGIYGGGRMK